MPAGDNSITNAFFATLLSQLLVLPLLPVLGSILEVVVESFIVHW